MSSRRLSKLSNTSNTVFLHLYSVAPFLLFILRDNTVLLNPWYLFAVRAGPIRLPQNHPMVKMWENVLKGEVKQDVASYEHIITSVFQHGALPFSDNSPPKDASGDFVLIERKSHTALYNEIANVAEKNTRDKSLDHAGHGYVVVGPPGIGNSCSLNLVFLRCAAIEEVSEGSGKRRRPVIVCDRAVDKEDGRYLIFTPGTDPKVEISYVKPDALRDRQNIYLFESPKDSASHDRYIHEYNSAFYVVASNPNRNIDEGIQNSARMSYAYCWEPEEAEEVQKALGLQADPAVVARCGFSLRLLTTGQAGAVTAMQRVESALDAVHSQYDLRRMAFKFRRHDGGLSTLSTALLTMKPCNGGWGCLYSICPVSDYVRQRLRSKLGTQQLPGMDYIVDLFD